MFAPTVRILLVEDEVLIQDMLRGALEESGYEVVSADSADEAMCQLDTRGQGFGGLVTDVNLGAERFGWDVARRAREVNGMLPVVYVSGDSAAQWCSRGVPNSAMLTKPFAPAQLIVALASLTAAS